MNTISHQIRNRAATGKPRTLTLGVALALTLAFTAAPANAERVIVYAASSQTNALGEVAEVYEQQSDNEIKISFASSSTLARQIAQGAPAEVYVSANLQWVDYVEKKGEILAHTRKEYVANQLALVAPTDSKIDEVDIHAGFPILDLLDGERLAIANPAHVPAGIYGKQALKSLDLWKKVEDKLVRGSNVRVTLNYVANGGIPLGIVYSTDAAVADDVKVVGIFPPDSHAPIIYGATLTREVGKNDKAARDFFKFMDSEKADQIMKSYGFKVLD